MGFRTYYAGLTAKEILEKIKSLKPELYIPFEFPT